MDIASVKELINIVNESSLTTFEMEQDGVKLVMKKDNCSMAVPQVTAVPQNVAAPQNITALQNTVVSNETAPQTKEAPQENPVKEGQIVKSPMVGTFYSSSSPDKPAYVKVGDKVKKGQVLCIIEAMKLMNEIESTLDGEIVEILVNNEDMVEYGQDLFVIR